MYSNEFGRISLQILTILESGIGDSRLSIHATDLKRFDDLISLDIRGLSDGDRAGSNSVKSSDGSSSSSEQKGIVLSAETFHPLANKLLHLNLERVALTQPRAKEARKHAVANFAQVKPVQLVKRDDHSSSSRRPNRTATTSHRLIFLTNSEEKEILPYHIYKRREMEEGYDHRLSTGLFTELVALRHLRCKDCALRDVTWRAFDGLEQLEYLSLQRNGLRFIPEFCFYGAPNLRTLSLADNEISYLKSVDLAGLLSLERLDLSGNNLTLLSELSLPPFPALFYADFRDNPLKSIFPR